MKGAGWKVWVDTGGTFTDCVAVDPEGGLHREKVLSSSCLRLRLRAGEEAGRLTLLSRRPFAQDFFKGATLKVLGRETDPVAVSGFDASRRELRVEPGVEPGGGELSGELRFPCEAPILAAALAIGTPPGGLLPPLSMRLATTRGTNALLERRGSRVALFLTQGFADLLRIGTQQRQDLFALDVRPVPPLYEAVIEVPGRLGPDGSVERPVELDEVERRAAQLLEAGCDHAAVCLLHSYRNPAHEEAVGDLLAAAGFRHVSLSARLASRIKAVPRAETAVVNAYLSNAIDAYLASVAEAVGEGALHLMTSAGGLVEHGAFSPKDSLLSGPAGGVVGASLAGRRSAVRPLLAFDMGGTSTDVSRWAGDYEYRFETFVGGIRVLAPALEIETVAAGGGSVCAFERGRLRVGPESAGSRPGPACYGVGGPPTLTDVNLLLGRLAPELFEIPIDEEAARTALDALRQSVGEARGETLSRQDLLSGLLAIANQRMAEAMRRISIRRGYDPADHVLVSFGGAAGQHACAIADLLGIEAVLVPEDASLLSAHGLGHARVERFATRELLRPLDEMTDELERVLAELEARAVEEVALEGVERERIEVRRRIFHLRLRGQEASLTVEGRPGEDLLGGFRERYFTLYGYEAENRPVEVESIQVVASSIQEDVAVEAVERALAPPSPRDHRRAFLDGVWGELPVYDRGELRPGTGFNGPALVVERHSTTLLGGEWRLQVDGARALRMERR